MASDGTTGVWWKNPRVAVLWIFGCAVYYYVRFTRVFLHEFGDPIRQLWSQLAEWLALSSGTR